MSFDFFDSPELLDIQRKAFYRFLNQGIPELLGKQFPIKTKSGNYSIELLLNDKNIKLITPDSNPRDCILKMKTYSCKLYAQVKIVCRKTSPLLYTGGAKQNFANTLGALFSKETLSSLRQKKSLSFASNTSHLDMHLLYLSRKANICKKVMNAMPCVPRLAPTCPYGARLTSTNRRFVRRFVCTARRTPTVKGIQSHATRRFASRKIHSLLASAPNRAIGKSKICRDVDKSNTRVSNRYIDQLHCAYEHNLRCEGLTPHSHLPKGNLGKSKVVVYQSKLEWVLLGQLPMMTKRGHFIINGSPRVIVHQVVRSPGIYFQKLANKDDRKIARFYGDIIPLKGVWVRLQMTKKGRIEAKFKKGKKVQVEFLQKCLQVIEDKNSFSSFTPRVKSNTDTFETQLATCALPRQQHVTALKARGSKAVQIFDLQDDYKAKVRQNWISFPCKSSYKSSICTCMSFSAPKYSAKRLVAEPSVELNLKSPLLYEDYSAFLSTRKSRAEYKSEHEAFINTYDKLYRTTQDKELEAWQKKKSNLSFFKGLNPENAFKRKKCSENLFACFKLTSRYDLGLLGREKINEKFNAHAPVASGLYKSSYKSSSCTCKCSAGASRRIAFGLQIEDLYFATSCPDLRAPTCSYLQIGDLYARQLLAPTRHGAACTYGSKHSKQRASLNRQRSRLSDTQLTSIDLSDASVWLYKLRKGEESTDDIDHSQNRRVRTSGELLQTQFENGVERLKNLLSTKLEEWKSSSSSLYNCKRIPSKKSKISTHDIHGTTNQCKSKICNSYGETFACKQQISQPLSVSAQNHSIFSSIFKSRHKRRYNNKSLLKISRQSGFLHRKLFLSSKNVALPKFSPSELLSLNPEGLRSSLKLSLLDSSKNEISVKELFSTKPITGALREFFGSNPLSQYMDQTNPLAEITHKRRISSLGAGGVSRESAGMAIRGIHPTHYGRICPIETPEGKNAGLVNSLAFYTKLDRDGFLKTPYYRVVDGQIQPALGFSFTSAKAESLTGLYIAPSDLQKSANNVLRTKDTLLESVPVRVTNSQLDVFKKENPAKVQLIGISPIQMISVATSLIPFLEHNDANRALMGSNMQRQAVPLMIAERPIVGTGLESIVIVESGHITESPISGFADHITATKVSIERLTFRKKNIGGFSSKYKYKSSYKSSICTCKNSLWPKIPFNAIRAGGTYMQAQNLPHLAIFSKSKIGKKICKATHLIHFARRASRVKPVYLRDKAMLLAHHANLCKSSDKPKVCRRTEHGKARILPFAFGLPKVIVSGDFVDARICNLCMQNEDPHTRFQNQKSVVISKYLPPIQSELPWFIKQNSFLSSSTSSLTTFSRSNQNTCITEKPLIRQFDWVQKGDVLSDCSASNNGELSVGKNVLVAYIPWEGYNFEDAIVISERLVREHVYTSLHIERYTFQAQDLNDGHEWFTKDLPGIDDRLVEHLEENGLPKIGSFLKEGDILVGKIRYLNKKPSSPYERLLCDILGEKNFAARNKSLYVPKGVEARVIYHKVINQFDPEPDLNNNSTLLEEESCKSSICKPSIHVLDPTCPYGARHSRQADQPFSKKSHRLSSANAKLSAYKSKILFNNRTLPECPYLPLLAPTCPYGARHGTARRAPPVQDTAYKSSICMQEVQSKQRANSKLIAPAPLVQKTDLTARAPFVHNKQGVVNKASGIASDLQTFDLHGSPTGKEQAQNSARTVNIFLGEKRVIQVGDKISGRHGNKGVISTILPRQDMPYLPDGTPIDLILNPLGVPSRMNVGQVLECLLGLAADYLKQNFKITAFDERYGVEASKSLVFLKLYQARLQSGQNWLFQVNFPGKTRLVDGRSGECFDQWITVGKAYILKLIHMVSEKIHARSTGPYALITQQPLRGRSNKGGQRLGEMEVWALEGFGAAYTLQELLTKKSDDYFGRNQIVDSILPKPPSLVDTLSPNYRVNQNRSVLGHPEIFKVLLCELQALCLDLGVYVVTPESYQRSFLGVVH